MAGCFPGTANCQQFDINGNPLSACLLTVYVGGTTTLAATFQDIGLAIPSTNPLVADASGRLPLFFVADGTYALRLTDQYGIQSNGGFYLPQVPSIGASSSGGGGSVVDPTTVFSTGDVKARLEQSTISGWVRLNGRTIGNASSGASERANADCQALFIYIWQTYADAICPVVGGRGSSALSDFNANKQITLLDARDRVIVGLDDMGNTALGGLGLAPFTKGNATTGGASGGESGHALVAGEIPTITSGGSASISATSSETGVPSGATNGNLLAANGPSTGFYGPGATGTPMTIGQIHSSGSGSVAVSSSNTGGGSHNNTPLFLLATIFWKL